VTSGDDSTRVVWGGTGAEAADDEPLPVELDRYAVLETLGRGGMGVVYAAYDPELDRTVALKVVRPKRRAGIDADAAQRALLREARAVAALNHPNVVAIFDAGRVGDRVWFAMEHVRGTTLARWLEHRAPGWRAIVDVFAQAGRGLAAAHRAGLVHGDFKPQNVLIGEHMERVVVVDFGLAHPRTTDSPVDDPDPSASTSASASASGRAFVLGTPLFMAPESLRLGITDAGSDQFAFCIALWQALWRKHPFAADDDDPRVVLPRLRAHRRGPPPARGPVPAAVRRALERGLSRDPGARWPDMDALLEALVRGSARWRLAWIAVPCAAAAGLAVLASDERTPDCSADAAELDALWNETRRAEVEASIASVERGYAADVAHRVGARLDEHAGELRRAAQDSCVPVVADAEMGRKRRRACLQDGRAAMEALLAELATADAALLDHAIDATAALPSPDGCELAAVRDDAAEIDAREDALRPELARLHALVGTGRVDAAIALGESLLASVREQPDGPVTAVVLDALASAYEAAARLPEAERAWAEAVWVAEAQGRDDIAAIAAISLVSSVGFQQSRPADGLGWARHAEAALARSGADDAMRAGLHNSLGLAHVAAGDYAAAVAEYEVALALVANGKPLDRASLLNNLGPALLKQGRHAEARAVLEESLAIYEEAHGEAHPRLAGPLGNVGLVAQEQGDHEAALAYLQRALAIGEAAWGADHPNVAFFVNNIAVNHYERGRFAEALPMYRRVVASLEKAYGEHPSLALALGNEGLVLVELGRAEEALAVHRRALEISTVAVGEDHPDFAQALNNIGSALRELGRLDEARSFYERALALRERLLGADHPFTATTVLNLGLVAARAGDHARAREYHARALAIWEEKLGPDHARVAMALVGLGDAARELGDPGEAQRLLERALEVAQGSDGDPMQIAEARFALARTERALGRRDRARVHAEAALAGYEAGGPRVAAQTREVRAFLADR
jgi:tetratricopeptide (TPR) repeat protein/tRNA A-37 threonylcarbamoyl transferase component Bud32